MSFHGYLWIFFNLAVLVMLALDLGLAKRRAQAVTTRSAVVWTLVWIGLSLALGAGIWILWRSERGLQFFTGYLIEYALSVDNLFVFVLIFGYFKVETRWQHKLLFWGVLGAFAMRAGLILIGAELVEHFDWLFYLFGAFLLFSALKLLLGKEDEGVDPEHTLVLRLARRFLPIAKNPEEGKFFVREEGRLKATRLFLVLVVIEATDLLFAADSIPAVLGVSNDRFVLYSSNVCAVLGLRTLYFLIAALMAKLHFLKFALAAVLAFVGLKMVLHDVVEIPTLVSLVVIAGMLGTAVVASLLRSEVAGG
jgi:tellurite resistance protein TerC